MFKYNNRGFGPEGYITMKPFLYLYKGLYYPTPEAVYIAAGSRK